ncbi:CocE/NonD family hydrolase [Photobacterium satsumensis]|uniref:CocE/NonD family hydrolase n=1 Tax=Photobacterium satsumensis TaxID=2910239 RepID=UPI003D0F8389
MKLSKIALVTALFSQYSYAMEPREDFTVYVTMPDGVKIAADVHLPERDSLETKIPTLINQTRYWRSKRLPLVDSPDVNNPEHWKDAPLLTDFEEQFIDNGYAVVKVDVRGTGASTGKHEIEYAPQEGFDGAKVLDWIIAQGWSNGNVGAYGISYKAATSEMLSMVGHPALKAAAPWGAGYLDHYRYYVRPYGVAAQIGSDSWGKRVANLDSNNHKVLQASVRPVESDVDGSTLEQAVAEHSDNPDVGRSVSNALFVDDEMANGYSFADLNTIKFQKEIEKAGVPLFKMTGWLDAITSDASLAQFNTFDQSQTLYIMPVNHGGRFQADPFTMTDDKSPSSPSALDQWAKATEFFDYYLKEEQNGVDKWAPITYWNFGEGKFRTTEQWPPAGVENQTFYMHANKMLSQDKPSEKGKQLDYKVDFDTTTGYHSRWMTQFGGFPILGLHDRSEMDSRMLTFTSQPMEKDTQITGQVSVSLELSSTTEDGLVIAYLESVAPDGTSRYVTEGGLQISKRKLAANPYGHNDAPHPSFVRADERFVQPGEEFKLEFTLGQTSVLVKKGDKLRVAFAGADKDNFVRTPAKDTPTYTFKLGKVHSSSITLPIQG